jgi:hypothetical protein
MDFGAILALVACLVVVVLVVRQNKKDDKQQVERVEPQPTGGSKFPLKFEASINLPSARHLIAARNAHLLLYGPAKNFVFDYSTLGNPEDNSSLANTALGGGTPYGGIYLSGALHIETDERGQCTAASWVEIFGNRKPLQGGIDLNGKIGVASPEMGCGVSGQVGQDGTVSGMVFEAGTGISEEDSAWGNLSEQDRQSLKGFATMHKGFRRLEYVHGNFESRVA